MISPHRLEKNGVSKLSQTFGHPVVTAIKVAARGKGVAAIKEIAVGNRNAVIKVVAVRKGVAMGRMQ